MARLTEEKKERIMYLHEQGYSGVAISKMTGVSTGAISGVVGRCRKKVTYPPHCYTCEYRVESSMAKSKNVTPDVIGCLLGCDTPRNCQKWKDDQVTARAVKAALLGSQEVRENG